MNFNQRMECISDHKVSQYFDEMLQKAQTLFGERDNKYHIAKIHFSQEKYPQIFFPEDGVIDIRLTICAENDISKACFQLSHEVTHLIAPNINEIHGIANNLEEGTACWFSQYCVDNDIGNFAKGYKYKNFNDPNFETVFRPAYEAVKPLFDKNDSFIKKLREGIIGDDKRFHRICDKSIRKLFPELSDSCIEFLLDRFVGQD